MMTNGRVCLCHKCKSLSHNPVHMLSREQRAVYEYAAAMLQAEGVFNFRDRDSSWQYHHIGGFSPNWMEATNTGAERIDAYNWHHDQYFLRTYGPFPFGLPHPEQLIVEEDMGFGHVDTFQQLRRRRRALVATVKGFSQHFMQSYYN